MNTNAVKCRYCRRRTNVPCMSTRDMEDRVIHGSDVCLAAPTARGGGERGIDRVLALRREHEETREPASSMDR